MKKTIALLLLFALFFVSCGEVADSSLSVSEENSSAFSEENDFYSYSPENENKTKIGCLKMDEFEQKYHYSLDISDELSKRFEQYFDISSLKGIECYAWLTDGEVFFGLMQGTNRLKTDEEIKSLVPATLGEIRAILTRYTFEKRSNIVLLTDGELDNYTRELAYLLGIGKYCIEYSVSYNGEDYNVVYWNESGFELYDYLSNLRKNANGDKISILESDNYIDIAFGATGDNYLGQKYTHYGNYRIYYNGNCQYYDSVFSSSIYTYSFPLGAYAEISAMIDKFPYPREYKEVREPECRITYGIGTQGEHQLEYSGDEALALCNLIGQLMEDATMPTEEQIKAHYGIKQEDNTVPSQQAICVILNSEIGMPRYYIFPDGFVIWWTVYASSNCYCMFPEDTFDKLAEMTGIAVAQ